MPESTEPKTPPKTLVQAATEARNEPVTMKDRIVGVVIGLAMIGFGVGTWLNPELIADAFREDSPSGRGGRKIVFFLNLAWNRPVGSILLLLGLLVLYGALTRKKEASSS